MNKKITAVIIAIVLALVAVGVGLFIHFSKDNDDISSYTPVTISPEEIIFAENSNKSYVEIILNESRFKEVFGMSATTFAFDGAKEIPLRFSSGEEYIIPAKDKDIVKTEKIEKNWHIKIYVEDKKIFETVEKTVRFDTAYSFRIIFPEKSFITDDSKSRAVSISLKGESKIASNVENVYAKASYQNYVLKLSLVDNNGNEVLFTTSGKLEDKLAIYGKKEHSFSASSTITERFRTAIFNPSDDLGDNIKIYIPSGFFVNSKGNRLNVVGFKDSDEIFSLAEKKAEETTASGNVSVNQQTVEIKADDVTPIFENEVEIAGETLKNLTDIEVIVSDSHGINFEGLNFEVTILKGSDYYQISSDFIGCLYSSIQGGYIISIVVGASESCEIADTIMNGIACSDSDIVEISITATDENSNTVAIVNTDF